MAPTLKKTRRHAGRSARWLGVALATCVVLPLGAADVAQGPRGDRPGPRPEQRERLTVALDALEHAMMTVREAGQEELLEPLQDVAERLRMRLARADGGGERRERDQPAARRERERLERQLEVLRSVHGLLRESDRGDAAEMIERAIHARELAIEGRRDERARGMRERGPNRNQMLRLLNLAIRLSAERGNGARAEMIERARNELWPRGADRPPDERRARETDRPPTDRRPRETPRDDLEIMRMALHAMLETQRPDAAEMLERAIHARELDMGDPGSPETRRAQERAPDLGMQIELLEEASHLWSELGHERKSQLLRESAQTYRARAERRGEPTNMRSMDDRGLHREIDELNASVADLREMVDRLRDELNELRERR